MTREQFNRLLRNSATIDLNFISDLEEITRRFPYFTNAHILLAKQYHGHENIKYESHLRKASAYAPDRTILYHLIRQTPDEVIHITAPASDEKADQIAMPVSEAAVDEFSTEINTATVNPTEDKIITGEGTEILNSDHQEVQSAIADTQPNETEPGDSGTKSPLEIIEQRLRELEQRSGSAQPEEKSAEPAITVSGEEISSPADSDASAAVGEKERPVNNNEPETHGKQPAEMKIVRTEKSSSLTSAESASQKVTSSPASHPAKAEPEPPKEPKAPKTLKDIPITHSFSEWLKIKSVPVIAAENISEFLIQDKGKSEADETTEYQPDLIEKFIKSEPRIVPGKSEFYSPGNMARKSAVEHEDLISETLARIYAQQGNIPKAIDAYQRLSLKNPEKSAYFAALIKELEERSEG